MGLKIYVLHCYRCNHEWSSRNPHPNLCAKCKSKRWDTPRTKHKRKPIPTQIVQAAPVAGTVEVAK